MAHPEQHRVGGAGAEGGPPGRRVGHGAAPGEHVRGWPDDVDAVELLGAHVAGGADRGAHPGEDGDVGGERDPEVDDLGTGLGEQHVARLEVAVHDAGAVHGQQRLGEPDRQRPQRRPGDRPVAQDPVGERGPGEELGGEVGRIPVGVGGIHPGGAHAPHPAHQLDLAAEPGTELRRVGQLRADHLHRHRRLPEHAVVDDAHAAGADPRHQRRRPQPHRQRDILHADRSPMLSRPVAVPTVAPRRHGATTAPRDALPVGAVPSPSCPAPFRAVRGHITAGASA